nr:alpha/beta hydrolase [Staphylococcus carnosus]
MIILKEQHVTFKTRDVETAGILRTPDNATDQPLPTIVVMHPISSVKEQTASIYAKRLTEEGFATLAFDAAHQGEIAAEPKNIEVPYYRVDDAKAAIDYLNTLDIVDDKRIGILGICGGGGYAVNASLTDKRIKAVSSVVSVNFGMIAREGDFTPDSALKTLYQVAEQREAEAKGGEQALMPYAPDSEAQRKELGLDDIDIKEAVDYYRTDLGYHENVTNRYRVIDQADVIGFDAYHLADKLLDQPLYIVAGDKPGAFGSYRCAYELFDKALSDKKTLNIVKGVSHYDLYDQPKAVDEALKGLVPFYKKYL